MNMEIPIVPLSSALSRYAEHRDEVILKLKELPSNVWDELGISKDDHLFLVRLATAADFWLARKMMQIESIASDVAQEIEWPFDAPEDLSRFISICRRFKRHALRIGLPNTIAKGPNVPGKRWTLLGWRFVETMCKVADVYEGKTSAASLLPLLTSLITGFLNGLAELEMQWMAECEQQNRHQRRRIAKQNRQARTDKADPIKNKVIGLWQTEKKKRRKLTKRQASKEISQIIFSEAHAAGVLSSQDNAERTVYEWLLKSA